MAGGGYTTFYLQNPPFLMDKSPFLMVKWLKSTGAMPTSRGESDQFSGFSGKVFATWPIRILGGGTGKAVCWWSSMVKLHFMDTDRT